MASTQRLGTGISAQFAQQTTIVPAVANDLINLTALNAAIVASGGIAINTKWYAYAKANPIAGYNVTRNCLSPTGAQFLASAGAAEGTAVDTTLGTSQGMTTTAGGGSGVEIYPVPGGPTNSCAYMQRQMKPFLRMRIKTNSALTSWRCWIGFFSGSPAASNDPAGLHLMAFRFVQGVDTNWMCCTKDGATLNPQDSGITVAVSTIYDLQMVTNSSGNIEFYINGVLVKTLTTNLPTTTQTMGNIGYYGNATTAVSVVMYWSDLYVQQN